MHFIINTLQFLNRIRSIFTFLSFFLQAKGKFRLHSPFLYQFYTKIIEDHRWFYQFSDFELLRSQLLKNQDLLKIIDYGAGSSYSLADKKTVRSIVCQQTSHPYQMRVLARIIEHFEPEYIIEIGTSIGLSSLYIASNSKNSNLYALEGNPNFIEYAKKLSAKYKIKNIQFIEGQFDETLPQLISDILKVDLVFFDGNHTSVANQQYFELCLKKSHSQSIFIFDDIYWSKDMTQFWNNIRKHKEVTLSIDLYFMGILFFDKKFKDQQNVKLRPDFRGYLP